MTVTATEPSTSPAERVARLDGPVHSYFGLSYSNYQAIHRTLMQSMPIAWQERMVACLEELRDAYAHIEHPDAYEVTAAVECTYSDLNDADMRELGIARPDAPDSEHDESWGDRYYDRDSNEHRGWERVLVPRPGGDPIAHYNRGRTFIEPKLGSDPA